jgi:hypothetical protein
MTKELKLIQLLQNAAMVSGQIFHMLGAEATGSETLCKRDNEARGDGNRRITTYRTSKTGTKGLPLVVFGCFFR